MSAGAATRAARMLICINRRRRRIPRVPAITMVSLPPPYRRLQHELAAFIPAARLVTDPLRLLAWGTDASFYRLVPKLVVVVDDEGELGRVLACCARLGTPGTFPAAGTGPPGQA